MMAKLTKGCKVTITLASTVFHGHATDMNVHPTFDRYPPSEICKAVISTLDTGYPTVSFSVERFQSVDFTLFGEPRSTWRAVHC